ncbi:MAG: hypothetical protein ABR915_07670 [Thermoguttaceae bacterium]|jgi:hypothetical protein
MSEQENPIADLTAFETALASLAPRVEGFDREGLIFLAGRASVLRKQRDGRSLGARWGWPAAFSAMTAVAASLLVMLCVRAGPTVVIRSAEPGAAVQGIAGNQPTDLPLAPDQPIAAEKGDDRGPGRTDLASADSYAGLRQRMLLQGDESCWPRPPASSVTTTVAEGPLPYHVLLDRLLKKQPFDISESGESTN